MYAPSDGNTRSPPFLVVTNDVKFYRILSKGKATSTSMGRKEKEAVEGERGD
jgi:hypothetical protein